MDEESFAVNRPVDVSHRVLGAVDTLLLGVGKAQQEVGAARAEVEGGRLLG